MHNKLGDGMKLDPFEEADGTLGCLSFAGFELIGRNGWGATIVDGLSTLLIAGLQDEVVFALNYTVKVDFTSPDGLVDPFETIIRYNNSIGVLIVDMLADLFQQ